MPEADIAEPLLAAEMTATWLSGRLPFFFKWTIKLGPCNNIEEPF